MNIIRILKKAIYNYRKSFFSKQITRKCLSTLSKNDLFILRNAVQKGYDFLQTNDDIKEVISNCSGLCSYFDILYRLKHKMTYIEHFTIKQYIQLEIPYRTDNGYFWTPRKWEPRKKYLKMLLQEIELMLNNYEHSRS